MGPFCRELSITCNCHEPLKVSYRHLSKLPIGHFEILFSSSHIMRAFLFKYIFKEREERERDNKPFQVRMCLQNGNPRTFHYSHMNPTHRSGSQIGKDMAKWTNSRLAKS